MESLVSAILLAGIGLGAMAAGYRFYSKFIAEHIYQLDPDFETPPHTLRDDIDFIPTNRVVLWGHHFTAVAGAALLTFAMAFALFDEVTSVDLTGALLCVPVLAYLIHLWLLPRKG